MAPEEWSLHTSAGFLPQLFHSRPQPVVRAICIGGKPPHSQSLTNILVLSGDATTALSRDLKVDSSDQPSHMASLMVYAVSLTRCRATHQVLISLYSGHVWKGFSWLGYLQLEDPP